MVDMSSFESSTVPDNHKTARRAQLSRHHAAVRAQERRIETSTLYRQDGTLCHDNEKIGEELRRSWLPVFALRRPGPSAMHVFLPLMPPSLGFRPLGHGSAASFATSPDTPATPRRALTVSGTASGLPRQAAPWASSTTPRSDAICWIASLALRLSPVYGLHPEGGAAREP